MDKREELFLEIESVIELADFYGNKWNLLILFALHKGKCRFNTLLKVLKGISKRTLSETLKKFESTGILTRTVFAEVPPRVEYELTDKGANISGLIANLFEQNNQLLNNPIEEQEVTITKVELIGNEIKDIEPIQEGELEVKPSDELDIEEEVALSTLIEEPTELQPSTETIVPDGALIIDKNGSSLEAVNVPDTPKIKFTGLTGNQKENVVAEEKEKSLVENIKVAVPIIAEELNEQGEENIYSSNSQDDEILAELNKAADYNSTNKPLQVEEEPKKLINPLRKLFGHNRKEGEE